jgi:hypothetical protein
MNANVDDFPVAKGLKMVAAVFIGLGIGSALNGTVAVPGLGAVPGLAVGAVGVLAGGVLYTQAPTIAPGSTAPGCGCEGDCGCS